MTLTELKAEIRKYQYFEDDSVIDVALASVISTRLSLGEPVWLVLIGPSSGGKSQILRPLALTQPEFMHRVDDVTENTFLSAMNSTSGDVSLLSKIGPKGIIVISDLTVLFSKSPEARTAILSQFRMIYDGELVKHAGNRPEPLKWKGSLGVIAGSTPSIYVHFEEVADMGERFLYYRMKEYDADIATTLALDRTLYGKELDSKLSSIYKDYLSSIVPPSDGLALSPEVKRRIIRASLLAEQIRTPIHTDWHGDRIVRIPVPAMPMRIALQLTSIAKGLLVMRQAEGLKDLTDNDIHTLEWCAYSLGNEEKRACLRILAAIPSGSYANTQTIADRVGLYTAVVENVLQVLAATNVIERTGSMSNDHMWRIKEDDDRRFIREIENIRGEEAFENRGLTATESREMKDITDHALEMFASEARKLDVGSK